jgi:hypothetical protein
VDFSVVNVLRLQRQEVRPGSRNSSPASGSGIFENTTMRLSFLYVAEKKGSTALLARRIVNPANFAKQIQLPRNRNDSSGAALRVPTSLFLKLAYAAW